MSLDLRSGLPYWIRKNGWPSFYPPQNEDLRCDVAIVGGGISGALTAHQLSQSGVGVVLIDRRGVGEGSTAASTSRVLYEIDAEMVDLAERYSHEVAVRAYRAGLEAIDAMERIIDELLASGEDTCSTDHRRGRRIARQARKLERRLHAMFPDRALETACIWGGTFGESPAGLPIIASPPTMPYAYFALGYGGNVSTFSVVAAHIMADLFLGQPSPDAKSFGFGRLKSCATPAR